MTWADYEVTIYDGSNPPRTVTIRGISRKDVEWVAVNPCQRNGHKPVADKWDGVIVKERVS